MGWKVKQRERYALIEVDEGNPLVHRGTFHIGPRHVKHHDSKEFVEHAYVENPDFASEKDCRVFAQSSNIAVEVYDFYNKLFDPDYENISVYDERFEVQYLFKEPDTWRSADYYNPRIEVVPLEDGVNIKKIFDTDYGLETLEITYTVRTRARLKHTIVFTNKTAIQRTFRVVMKFSGITSDKVKHGQVEERITEEEHIVAPIVIFGEDNQHLKLSEYLWSLGETDEETGEWTPTTLKDVVLDVHAQGCKVDIIIGNYVLAENEELLIDPDSDTWVIGASSDDCARRIVPDYWLLTAAWQAAGRYSGTLYGYGGGMRFTGLTIPQGSIVSSSFLTFKCRVNRIGTVCNTKISAEAVDNALTFADDKAAFDTRYTNHTTAMVEWDGIEGWILNSEYTSDDIQAVIQEILNREGWSSGNAIAIFWEDYDYRSTGAQSLRSAYTYDTGQEPCNLEVTWEVPLPPLPTGGIPPLILRPPPRRVPFMKRLISFGRIRRPFTQAGYIAGRIRRLFADNIVFTATSVKHIEEELSVDGVIVTEAVSDRVWEALFKAIEQEE